MNKYFVLDFACGTSETGPEYPQVQEMGKRYDYDGSNSIYALEDSRSELPDFTPDLDHFVLHKKAKPTDLISNSVNNITGFLLSGNFQKLLSDYNLGKHKFYQAKVMHQNSQLKDYFWLQLVIDFSAEVDFSRSEFFIFEDFEVDKGAIKISSWKDYDSKSKDLKKKERNKSLAIWAKRIVMNEKFDRGLDLFSIDRFSLGFFISEKLADGILKAKLSGIEIKDTDLINI